MSDEIHLFGDPRFTPPEKPEPVLTQEQWEQIRAITDKEEQ